MLSATPGMEGDLWLAFRATGLYHSTNGGMSFAKLGHVQEAYSLGFGKAAPGRTYPALYLAGKIDQIFRRSFAPTMPAPPGCASTMTSINIGWISHVTGDPRIYGRVYFATGGRGIIYGDLDPSPRAMNNL